MHRKRRNSSFVRWFLMGLSCLLGAAQAAEAQWIGSWGTASYAVTASTVNQANGGFTYTNIVHMSVGGSSGTSIRVQLTNEFGAAPLAVGEVEVSASAGGGSIVPGTTAKLTFGGSAGVTIPAGAVAFSDPVAFSAPPLSNLAVSVYIPQQTISKASCHPYAIATSYQIAGSAIFIGPGGSPATTWCYLRGIDVDNGNAGGSIVVVGDSITDGYESTTDGNNRFTDDLAASLQSNSATANIGVLNKGILANELLGGDVFTGYGSAGLARLASDVFGQTGVEYLIVLEGINDLGYASPVDSTTTAAELIAGYQQLIAQAHSHGIKVYGGTITPAGGTDYYQWTSDTGRQTVNKWIRTSGAFDAVIDFDAALTNGAVAPAIPALQKQYDSGDHLHPNALGYQTMANAISLSLFGAPQSATTKK